MSTHERAGQPPEAPTPARLPPGQRRTDKFPVLSFGPVPRVDLSTWRFTVRLAARPVARWSWDEFQALPRTHWHGDIHCVTRWSRLDTHWEGVSIDDLLAAAGLAPPTPFALVESFDDYTTNVAVADLTGGRAMVATHVDGAPLSAEHGGPARLLVPHLYFWKSAKWISGLRLTAREEAGYWETRGYHMRGDPWRQQRYSDDE